MSAQPVTFLPALRILAAAPHRLMFFIGATNVLLAMAWWAVWLINAQWNLFANAQPSVPAGWMHAIIMQYHVLPSFIFGFLLTVFPRWMNQQPLKAAHYVPVGVGMFGGQALTLVGLFAGHAFLQAGAWLTAAGWSFGTVLLVRCVCRDGGRTWHAVSCAFALSFGLLGLLLYTSYLYHADARVMFVAMKMGTLALLLPIYFTVCHRMIPFFASGVIRNYEMHRPMWVLLVVWLAALTQLWLELRHAYTLVWLPASIMCVVTGWLAARWWPRRQAMPPLLRVLFIGFLWLPIAAALYTIQSAWFWSHGEFILGRAPAHGLFIGFFGSLLVAMVTRVTQGHSGRPLVLGKVAAFAFVLIQVVTITRVVAEVVPNVLTWQIIAALGWLAAFTPWIARSTWIYLTPRADGREG